MKTLLTLFKPALLAVTLIGFCLVPSSAYALAAAPAAAANNPNAANVYGTGASTATTPGVNSLGDAGASGDKVMQQIYGLIRFAYVFFYAIAVLLVAQAWMQFKQQKYDVMFASMGAALGLFLTPALIDFIHGLGSATKS